MEPSLPQTSALAGVTAAGRLINEGEIARLVSELDMATIGLQDSAATLGGRLTPVLRNEPSALNEATKELSASTDLGNTLIMLIGRVRATNSNVADISNRLEL